MFVCIGCVNLQISATDAPDLTNTDSLYRFFYGCENLNTDLSHWDVSSITSLYDTFSLSTVFNSPLNAWDVSKVIFLDETFYKCLAFDQDLSGWDVQRVVTMPATFRATSFSHDLGAWDTSSTTNMFELFRNSNQNHDLSRWDTSKVNTMSNMFRNSDFNQDLSIWDVSAATDLSYMFDAADAYFQDLACWNLPAVTSCDYIGNSDGCFPENIATFGCSPAPPACECNSFESQWDTTSDSQLTLPLVESGDYSFKVNWGDGSTDTIFSYNQAEVTHSYSSGSIYNVSIHGTIQGWNMYNTADNTKLLKITNWGPLTLGNAGAYFRGCSNLEITALDAPDLTDTPILKDAFNDCTYRQDNKKPLTPVYAQLRIII